MCKIHSQRDGEAYEYEKRANRIKYQTNKSTDTTFIVPQLCFVKEIFKTNFNHQILKKVHSLALVK